MQGVRTSDDRRALVVRMLERGRGVRETAQLLGVSRSCVSEWKKERALEKRRARRATKKQGVSVPLALRDRLAAIDRRVYKQDRPTRLSKGDREGPAILFENEDAEWIASLLDDIDWNLRFHAERERKQTRGIGNARGPNRQARDALVARLASIHDLGFAGNE